MVKRLAVTGGIGSGKTTVCKIFERIGIPVFYSDMVAKTLMDKNQAVKNEIQEIFGNDIYRSNGELHRKKLAEIVFKDKIALQKINAIIHPVVRIEFENWASKQSTQYVIQEAAIVFESGIQDQFDYIICTVAPDELRIKRVMQRDNVTREHVLQRMENQLNQETKAAESDLIIECNDIDLIIPQVIEIDKKIKRNGKI